MEVKKKKITAVMGNSFILSSPDITIMSDEFCSVFNVSSAHGPDL